MGKYRCGYCKFRFENAKVPKKCPYCGRDGSVMAEESAEELIRNVDKMFE